MKRSTGMMFSRTRREALGRLFWLGGSSLFFSWQVASCRSATEMDEDDEQIFRRKFSEAAALPLGGKPFGDLIAAVALSFKGSPYVAHSLEVSGPERLVVNLRAFDCLTFVESSLSIARCVRLKKSSFGDYGEQLQQIRYRSGIIDTYPSRLHYFTDWVADNQRKGIVRDMTATLGGVVRAGKIDFMSTHRGSYRQLENDEYFAEISGMEERLWSATWYYISQDQAETALDKVRTGDIVGMTSTVKGLDIAHTGLAYRSGGTVKLLHASSSGRAVEVTEGSLADYLGAQGKQDGLIVVRAMDPA
ncbi:MAG: N-acetylmuramoyl-L-alanine amidase-like domain-containing protein [Bacteroidota bacterium]